MPHSHAIAYRAPAALGLPQRTAHEELSAPVQEIMGRAPNWLLRSGMSIIAGVAFLVLVLTTIVHYPDTLAGRITVTGTNPPVAIVARQSGHLDQLLVHEKQVVAKGALLAVIRSTVDSAQAFKIQDILRTMQPMLVDPQARIDIRLPQNPALGAMQTPYAEFATAWALHSQLLADTYAEKTATVLRGQLDHKREQSRQIKGQVENAEREQQLARTRYNRMQELQKRDSLSIADLQEAERALLQQDRQQSTVRGACMEAEIAVGDYEKQIEALLHTRLEDLRKSHHTLTDSAQKLLAAIDLWELDYVLRAPVGGTVGFYDFWSGEQFVTAGKEVFIVAPADSPLIGRVPVQALGAGKIRPGQTVRIHFDDFPYKEFGIATGQVDNVSLVAQKGAHLVSVRLDSPLTTNYGRALPFKQEMMGEASIIIEDRSLLGRIFSEMRDAFVNHSAH
jgi:multidrug resistance efflux pump